MAPPAAATIADIARNHARQSPDRVALDDGSRRITFAQLDALADRIAEGLIAQGVQPGDVAGLAQPHGIEATLAALAIARAGAILCPLNPRYRVAELAPLLGQARPRVVVAASEMREVVQRAAGQGGVALRTLVMDSEVPEWAGRAPPSRPPPGRGRRSPAGDDPFTLLFTSGTTGKPKGAVATHGARMAWIRSALDVYGIGPDDRFLGAMPQAHSAGLTFTLIHLHAGATVRVLERFDADRVLQVAREEGITSMLAVPTMLRRLLDAMPADAPPLDALRRLVSCGSPLPTDTREQVLRRLTPHLYDYYGCTESSSIAVLRPHEQRSKAGSVGRPFPGVRVRIVDGEVWCDNPSTMRGYWNDEAATAAAFDGPWYRTGDLGHIDADGYLFIAGRAGDVIISGGINIHPAEIEQVLQLHPAVAEAAVAGVPDATWGKAVKAYVVLRPGASLSLAEAQRHCAEHLADFKKPRALSIVDSLPRNAAGKVVRGELERR
jgi:acyl-CoA synthetase (AMP-forming)/AMP-acid ligase II